MRFGESVKSHESKRIPMPFVQVYPYVALPWLHSLAGLDIVLLRRGS